MRKIFRILLILTVSSFMVSCEDEEIKEFGDVGEITLNISGNLQSAPTTITFSAEAENAEFFIWDFGYSKDANNNGTDLPMGATGDEVELTVLEKGVYSGIVKAYNGNSEYKSKEFEITVYSAEEDISINTSSTINLEFDRDLCGSDLSMLFDLSFEVLDPNSIVELAYVVRNYSSVSQGDFEITDTLTTAVQSYQYTTQTELLQSFNLETELVETGDIVNYQVYVVADNGETYMLDEVTETAVVNLSEPVILPTGKWTATNNQTGFSKVVELKRPSPFQNDDDGRYWISDFGLDWSNWSDYWYTIEFKIKCPEGDNPDYIIDLFGSGFDSGVDQTDTDRSGNEVAKSIRVMPYVYNDSKVGYYNPETKTITFKDVSLTDAWWAADNHVVDITFKYNE